LQAVSEKEIKFTLVETNFYQSNDFCRNQKWSEVSRNVVEGVVHREGAGAPAVRQGEEEAFNGAVPGAQVEEDQEADLEAGGAAVALEVVAIVVVAVVVDLVVVGVVVVEVSEGHSSAGCDNLFVLYLFRIFLFSISQDGKPKKDEVQR